MTHHFRSFLTGVVAVTMISLTACNSTNNEIKTTQLNSDSEVINRDVSGRITDFARSVAVDSTSANIYIGSASIKIASGDSEGAITDLTQAIKLNPKSITAYSARATAKFSEEDLTGALTDLLMAGKLMLGRSLNANVL
ncbi:MAG: hypothetical protein HGB23_04300 [Chlorobiaceae bacterium]|nr:hypothetical protein [Chlorobiaceae bacterium]